MQNQTPTSIVIRWRTRLSTLTAVSAGVRPWASLTNIVDDATIDTEHEVEVTGLTPGATVFYSVGSTIQGAGWR